LLLRKFIAIEFVYFARHRWRLKNGDVGRTLRNAW